MLSAFSLLLAFKAVSPSALAEPLHGFGYVPTTLQNILSNTHGSNLYSYPTDLTRGIVPKPIHSHNDYWHDIPFYSALSHGAISVEADVWLVNGTLYIGHEPSALTAERTLYALYIQPIVDTLHSQNPTTPFADGSVTKNGIFDTVSGQTLYLFIDVKTEGSSTWPQVLADLKPLLDAGYLTTTNGQTLKPGPVTVVGTGNTPFDYFSPDPATSSDPRYAFFDAPLAQLTQSPYNALTSLISPVASTDLNSVTGPLTWSKGLNSMQVEKVQEAIRFADAKGIMARFWETPAWPIQTRNLLWRQLWDAGVGLLNVDDLAAAAGFWEGAGTA